jgi:hypothetical protein
MALPSLEPSRLPLPNKEPLFSPHALKAGVVRADLIKRSDVLEPGQISRDTINPSIEHLIYDLLQSNIKR